MTALGRSSFAVRVQQVSGRWQVRLLAGDAGLELPELERALGAAGESWPGPIVAVVDSRLYLVVLRHGPGGMVRALISDVAIPEFVLAAEVVERYGISLGNPADETRRPGGDLDVLADDGLPAAELRPIVTADDLWADEMVLRIAERLGFAAELVAAVES